MKLINTKFNNSKFNQLKLINQGQLPKIASNGYKLVPSLKWTFEAESFQQPYVNIETNLVQSVDQYSYDLEQHLIYQEEISNRSFDQGDIYANKLYLINFNNCAIVNTSFVKIDFFRVKIFNTVIENCRFDSYFEEVTVENVIFINCDVNISSVDSTWSNVRFDNCSINMLTFRSSDANKLVFANCIVRGRFNEEVELINCKMI